MSEALAAARTATASPVPADRHGRRPAYPRLVFNQSSPNRLDLSAADSAWLTALRSEGARHDAAVGGLRALLYKAACFEVGRRRAALIHVRGEELDDIAMQAADDALVAILGKLDQFRGASRFTTWAYKFALLEAGVKLRRRAWQGREVILEPEDWSSFRGREASAQDRVEQAELFEALRSAVDEDLTSHQRQVFAALALNQVPIDVLAERLETTRGALYKTLHDARGKLRRRLETEGHFEGGTRIPEAKP